MRINIKCTKKILSRLRVTELEEEICGKIEL